MTDTPSISPALTPQEWRESQATVRGPLDDIMTDDDGYIRPLKPDRLHAIAAVALYGQPFGFTREELDALRQHVTSCGEYGYACYCTVVDHERQQSALAKIAALLPPEAHAQSS